jgi:hypothetical protein
MTSEIQPRDLTFSVHIRNPMSREEMGEPMVECRSHESTVVGILHSSLHKHLYHILHEPFTLILRMALELCLA